MSNIIGTLDKIEAPTGTLRIGCFGAKTISETYLGGQWVCLTEKSPSYIDDGARWYWVQEINSYLDESSFMARFSKLGKILYG